MTPSREGPPPPAQLVGWRQVHYGPGPAFTMPFAFRCLHIRGLADLTGTAPPRATQMIETKTLTPDAFQIQTSNPEPTPTPARWALTLQATSPCLQHRVQIPDNRGSAVPKACWNHSPLPVPGQLPHLTPSHGNQTRSCPWFTPLSASGLTLAPPVCPCAMQHAPPPRNSEPQTLPVVPSPLLSASPDLENNKTYTWTGPTLASL